MKLLIWDWDNTIANTLDALHKTYLELLESRNDHRKWTKKDTAQQMNYLSQEALKRFAPNEKKLKQLTQEFDTRFARREQDTKLIPHALSTLKWTQQHGFTNVLASHKQISALKAALNRHGLTPYFDKVFGNTTGNKTLPGYAKKILSSYPKTKQIYVVGDGISDMCLGTHLKATNILVVRPYACKPDKSIKVDYKIKKLTELKTILK